LADLSRHCRHDLPRHGRHQVLDRLHHRLEPVGDLLVGGFEAAHAVLLGIEIAEKPVALLAQETDLLPEFGDGNAVLGFGKDSSR